MSPSRQRKADRSRGNTIAAAVSFANETFARSLGDLSRNPGRTKGDSADVNITQHCIGHTGECRRTESQAFLGLLQLRAFAAVLLRRLFQTQFETFWPKYSPDQQVALKKELLTRITQLDDDENIRKKICYIVAELARSLMGKTLRERERSSLNILP